MCCTYLFDRSRKYVIEIIVFSTTCDTLSIILSDILCVLIANIRMSDASLKILSIHLFVYMKHLILA